MAEEMHSSDLTSHLSHSHSRSRSESISYVTVSDSPPSSGSTSTKSILKKRKLRGGKFVLEKTSKRKKVNVLRGPRVRKGIKYDLDEGFKIIFPMFENEWRPRPSVTEATSTVSDSEEFKKFRTRAWVEDNLRTVGGIQDDEEKMGSRMQELLDIPESEYINVLYEIRYLRDQQLRKRNAKLAEKMKKNAENDAQVKKRLNREKAAADREFSWSRIKQYGFRKRCVMLCKAVKNKLSIFYREHLFHNTWRKAGLYTPHFAVTFHNGACLAILIWAIIILVLVRQEVRELNRTFRDVESILSNRSVSIASAIFILFSGIFGLSGTLFHLGGFIYAYIVFFICGWAMFLANEMHESSFAYGDALNKYFSFEILEYLKNDGKDRDILTAIQTEFRCCGIYGPSDYGYNGSVALGQKFQLAKSCCHIRSFSYRLQNLDDCFISPDLGPGLQIYVNYEGCGETIKFYLQRLYKIKEPLYFFMIFVVIQAVMSCCNLSFHFFSAKKEVKPRTKKLTPGEMLMEAIEDNLLSSQKFDFENSPGSIDEIRKRLAECATINDFVTVILDLIREVDFVVNADPEALARTILGSTPRSIPIGADTYGTGKRPTFLDLPIRGLENQQALARNDFKYRYLMQEIPESMTREVHMKNLENDKNYPAMRFSLPGPQSDRREKIWKWNAMVGKLQKQKKITKTNARDPITVPPAALRNESLSRTVSTRPKFMVRKSRKVFPEEKFDIESVPYRSELHVLTRIIAESQAMVRDLHRKTDFVAKFNQNSLENRTKVTEAVKLLLNTEAMKALNPSYKKNRIQLKSVSTSKSSSLRNYGKHNKYYDAIISQPYTPVADHSSASETKITHRPHALIRTGVETRVTIAVQTEDEGLPTESSTSRTQGSELLDVQIK